MAYEALNNASQMKKNFIIVLNDNQYVHLGEYRRRLPHDEFAADSSRLQWIKGKCLHGAFPDSDCGRGTGAPHQQYEEQLEAALYSGDVLRKYGTDVSRSGGRT